MDSATPEGSLPGLEEPPRTGLTPVPVPRRPLVTLALATALAVAILGLDLLTPLGIADGMLYALVVLLTLGLPRRSHVVLATALCSLLVVAGLLLSPAGGVLWVAVINRSFSLLVLWSCCAFVLARMRLEQLLRGALGDLREERSKVRMLGGLLPICASCKKIRDGAGAWQVLERYLAQHSEAEFSHGLCPDCIAHLYPELQGKDPRG